MNTAFLALETRSRMHIGKVGLDRLDFAQALDAVDALVRQKRGGIVFTPNVDHIVMAENNARFRAAYAGADLSLVDGTPVLWASRLLGQALPEKISGSDLVMPLMQRAAARGHRVYFLGGDPGVAHAATLRLIEQFPDLRIVGTDDARVDVDRLDPGIIERVQRAEPDIVLLALGAPKQEIFAFEQRERLMPAVCVGVGASLDFVAGTRKRAPAWISRIGLEWMYRLLQEPRRLAARYLLRDPQFCVIVARQMLAGNSR